MQQKILALLQRHDPDCDFPDVVPSVRVGECHYLELTSQHQLPQPSKPDHYIFRLLARRNSSSPLCLYRLTDVVFSYVLNPLQYYLFDSEGRLLDCLICGATPFQEIPVIELSGTGGVCR